jgi:putative ABC transport system substrate-binding protein
MRRRQCMTLLGSAASMACWPLETIGQVINIRPMIVYLGTGTSWSANRYIDALRGGLAELGLAEGRNIEIVVRLAENHVERLQGLAEESVALNPALIAAGSSDAAVAAKKNTSSIPIISGALADAEHLGLVTSYARPGGNVTALCLMSQVYQPSKLNLRGKLFQKQPKLACLEICLTPKPNLSGTS